MASRIARSVFYVASTHVITTSVYMLVFSIPFALLELMIFKHLSPIVEATAFICGQVLVTSTAIYCSLANIRRTVIMLKPAPCTMAANITFSGIASVLVAMTLSDLSKDFVGTLQACGVIVGICSVFCITTRRSFSNMAREPYGEGSRGFPVIIRQDEQVRYRAHDDG